MSDYVKKEPKKVSLIDRIFAVIIKTVGVGIMLVGVGLIGLQIYGYLESGVWPPHSLVILFDGAHSWFRDPQSRFGLQGIVYGIADFIPLSVALFLVGASIWGATKK